MRKRNSGKRRFPALLLAVLLLANLLPPVPAYAAGEVGTNYIVKYQESEAGQTHGPPFEVVSEAEMRRLRDAGVLEWYEPDGEMTLLGGVSPYYADDKWDLTLVNAGPAFETGALGEGVRIGVLDSGVNPVPWLADSLLPARGRDPPESEFFGQFVYETDTMKPLANARKSD